MLEYTQVKEVFAVQWDRNYRTKKYYLVQEKPCANQWDVYRLVLLHFL